MRYYEIQIGGSVAYTSVVGGQNDPGALNVELDIQTIGAATPVQGGLVRVWGIGLPAISQAKNLQNQTIQISAGMGAGLPLSNPAQQGIIAQGYIYQAFGNWIGLEQTLDLVIAPGPGPKTTKPNIILNWTQGQTLATALQQTLQTAYPGIKTTINLDSKLVLPNDEQAVFQNLTQLAEYVKRISLSIIGGTQYPGVNIVFAKNAINAYDQSQSSSNQTKQIQFTDLIGQPTWLDSPTIQLKCAMRADLSVGDHVTLPQTAVTNTATASNALVNQNVAFQGEFITTSLRHIGNFRQPDAASWVTVIDAAALNVQAQQA